MKLVPYNKNDIEKIEVNRDRTEKLVDIMVSFIEMDADCVEITNHQYTNGATCQITLIQAIKRLGLLGIKIVRRGERVFLIKEQ